MKIQHWYDQTTGTWTYLVADLETAKAVVIDPVWDFDPVSGIPDTGSVDQILSYLEEHGLSIDYVLETHAHADHLSAAGYLRDRTGARIGIGEGICHVQAVFNQILNLESDQPPGQGFDRLLRDGDRLLAGSLEIKVMHTPGHTPDSVTYLVEDVAFIGDTLFMPDFGTARCDFPGGDAGVLYDSIQRIFQLPEDTRLLMCHDYPPAGSPQPRMMCTVAEARKNNIHIKDGTSREAFSAMRKQRDSQLNLPKLIYPSLQVNVLGGCSPEPEDNGVAYLKLPFNRTVADILQDN